MDRNARFAVPFILVLAVALRKESVDRNNPATLRKLAREVALRKESVDRNFHRHAVERGKDVALRKESVDRNLIYNKSKKLTGNVALRKESVDRNLLIDNLVARVSRRSPQGERG